MRSLSVCLSLLLISSIGCKKPTTDAPVTTTLPPSTHKKIPDAKKPLKPLQAPKDDAEEEEDDTQEAETDDIVERYEKPVGIFSLHTMVPNGSVGSLTCRQYQAPPDGNCWGWAHNAPAFEQIFRSSHSYADFMSKVRRLPFTDHQDQQLNQDALQIFGMIESLHPADRLNALNNNKVGNALIKWFRQTIALLYEQQGNAQEAAKLRNSDNSWGGNAEMELFANYFGLSLIHADRLNGLIIIHQGVFYSLYAATTLSFWLAAKNLAPQAFDDKVANWMMDKHYLHATAQGNTLQAQGSNIYQLLQPRNINEIWQMLRDHGTVPAMEAWLSKIQMTTATRGVTLGKLFAHFFGANTINLQFLFDGSLGLPQTFVVNLGNHYNYVRCSR